MALKKIDISKLQPGTFQPRENFTYEHLKTLSYSIKQTGLIQPIIVREISTDQYEIIAGERRWRAAQMANLHEVDVVIKHVSDESALAMALLENIQRESLNAIEEASGIRQLIERFHFSHQAVGEVLGYSRSHVSNLLRLEKLNDVVKKFVKKKHIEMGHARALLSLTDTEQLIVCRKIIQHDWSVRHTEKYIQSLQQSTKKMSENKDANILLLENQLSEKLNTKVTIDHTPTGKGEIKIQYFSLDELDGLLGKI